MDYTEVEKILFPELTGWLLVLKIFFILFNFGVMAFMVYVWVTTIYLKRLFVWDIIEFFRYRSINARRIDKEWNGIKRRLLTGKEAEFKLAIIEAALLVNDVLGRAGFAGANLAEKLEIRSEGFSDIEAMRAADKVYQDLVYDPSYSLDYPRAKAVILSFEQGLRDVAAFTEK